MSEDTEQSLALDVVSTIHRSTQWLLNIQDDNSHGWAEQQGRVTSTLNTAEVIIALLDSQEAAAGSKDIQEGVEFLLKHQYSEGPDLGAWPREVPSTDPHTPTYHVADLVRTTFIIEALIKAGKGTETEPIHNALAWLLGRRNKDHGWGYYRDAPSALMPTCFALLAIIEAHRAGMTTHEQGIKDGLKFLVEHYNKNAEGCFGEAGPLQAAHTIYAILTLQAARRENLSVYPQQEKQAIAWLLRNPDAARKQVEERILIDPSEQGNYGFMFLTEALLIRVLMNSEDKSQRGSGLTRDALSSIRDKLDASGGFYGYRVFSWSTAKVVSALSVAKGEYQTFPQRQPEYSGPKAGPFIISIAVLLFASFALYLTQLKQFGVLQAAFFVFLTLTLLLAYGNLREKSFTELVGNLMDILKQQKKEQKKTR